MRYYEEKDTTFGLKLLTLRERAGLTQMAVAAHVGVGERVIRNWEGGTHYPKEPHLKALIELYLHRKAFTPGQEHVQARTLWEQMRQGAFHRKARFDESWFASLLA